MQKKLLKMYNVESENHPAAALLSIHPKEVSAETQTYQQETIDIGNYCCTANKKNTKFG